ncbi:MAG: SDR family oxidoreductase, partial [Bacteroidota bacterium]
ELILDQILQDLEIHVEERRQGAHVNHVFKHSIMARSAANDRIMDLTPEQWLTDIYDEIHSVFKSFDGTMVISASVFLVDDLSGQVWYFNAEHPASVLYRNGKAGFIEEQPLDEWQSVMDANVRGPWLMAKAVGPWWIDNQVKGKMLLMSSVRGRHGNFSGYTGYCTSKGATDSLTRVLATEWAKHGITVNAIAPTVFRSSLTEWMWGDSELGHATRKRSLSRIPLGRLGEPEDLVGMALYLLSPASDFCTGQIMYVDGGYTAG